jgi:hypothetical protein
METNGQSNGVPSASLDGALAKMVALRDRMASQERMRAAKRLLRRLRGRGITMEVSGDKLLASGKGLSEEMAQGIRAHKAELILMLASGDNLCAKNSAQKMAVNPVPTADG